MLALARAFMQRPRLLLLDEPSLGLAPLLVTEVFRIVRELNEKEGVTVLVVEQNAHIALQLAQTAYVLEVGRVALVGAERRAAGARVRAPELPRLLMVELARRLTTRRRHPAPASGGGVSLPHPAAARRRLRLPRRRLAREHDLRAADRRRTREGRRLREPRARARPHLPRDRGDQLRAGRDGDGVGVHRIPAHRTGVSPTGRRSSPRSAIAFVARHASSSSSSSGPCSTSR